MAYSPEFTEEMLKQTKKYVPDWLFQKLVTYARPVAGGRARHRSNRVISDEEMERMSDDELEGMHDRFSKACDYRRRKREGINKAVWTTAYINTLPDSAFLHVSEGGEKDEEGKTVPRSLRHLPYRDDTGKVDLPHLRNALARIPQTSLPMDVKEKLTARARRVLEEINKSKLVFVGYELTPLEKARQEMFVGETGRIFDNLYLKSLDVSREDVVFTVLKDFDRNAYSDSVIVALGKKASKILGDCADFTLPHPGAVRKFGDSGEVKRKSRVIKQFYIDKTLGYVYDHCNEPIQGLDSGSADTISVKITKSLEEKKIVYGVVMDPYGKYGAQEDAHNDWPLPSMIEKSAHDYLMNSRKMRMEHSVDTSSQVVESWLEPYPSREDYENAMKGLPHSVTKRKFGNDYIHSGSWVVGAKLSDEEWNLFKHGKLNAFSPGGVGHRFEMSKSQMPDVVFKELVFKDSQ